MKTPQDRTLERIANSLEAIEEIQRASFALETARTLAETAQLELAVFSRKDTPYEVSHQIETAWHHANKALETLEAVGVRLPNRDE